MHATDSRIVVNPAAGPLTPTEAAVIAYQAYRDDHPLPDGWTQSILMVPDLDVYFSCYLESQDYVAAVLLPHNTDPTGSALLAVFRKDRATPTTLEVAAVTHQLFHPYLAPNPDRNPTPIGLDGSIDDRPLSYGLTTGRPHVGFEVELSQPANCSTPPNTQCEHPVPITIARPHGNDAKSILAATRLLLDYESERFGVVRDWIKQQHALVEPALSGFNSA